MLHGFIIIHSKIKYKTFLDSMIPKNSQYFKKDGFSFKKPPLLISRR